MYCELCVLIISIKVPSYLIIGTNILLNSKCIVRFIIIKTLYIFLKLHTIHTEKVEFFKQLAFKQRFVENNSLVALLSTRNVHHVIFIEIADLWLLVL